MTRVLGRRNVARFGGLLAFGALAFACSSSGSSASDLAQKKLTTAEKAASDAQSAYTAASTAFCSEAKDYIAAIDRYGNLFDTSATTVGDVKTGGADLAQPRASTETAAKAVLDSRDAVTQANQDLVDAQAALATAQQSAASGGTLPSTTVPVSTTTVPPLPTASIDLVKKAEADLTAASQGITDQTPLLQAGVKYNSAAFALEASWINLFADAGCLTGDQAVQGAESVRQYTVAVQTALQATGYYTGAIDGIYGPATVDAVKALQTASGLPVTGYMDLATWSALEGVLLQKGGAAAAQASLQATAVQTTLKLAGFWPGPVDGVWTPELTEALKAFQTSLGVPATGVVDGETLAAIEAKLTAPPATEPTSTTVPSSSSGN